MTSGRVIDINGLACASYPNVCLIPLHSFTILLLIPPWQTYLLHPLQGLSFLSLCNLMTSPPPQSQLAEGPTPRRRLSSPSSLARGNNPQRNSGETRAPRVRPASLRPRRHRRRPKLQQIHRRLMSGRWWPALNPMSPVCPNQTRKSGSKGCRPPSKTTRRMSTVGLWFMRINVGELLENPRASFSHPASRHTYLLLPIF